MKNRSNQKRRRHRRRGDALTRRARESAASQFGYVVYSNRRGGYILNRDLPAARGGFVGLTSNLQDAEFFTEGDDAARAAFWQLGQAYRARRNRATGAITQLGNEPEPYRIFGSC